MSTIADIDEDEAPSCDADVVVQADFVLNYEPRSELGDTGFEWDLLVEELRDEVVSLRGTIEEARGWLLSFNVTPEATREDLVRELGRLRRTLMKGVE